MIWIKDKKVVDVKAKKSLAPLKFKGVNFEDNIAQVATNLVVKL